MANRCKTCGAVIGARLVYCSKHKPRPSYYSPLDNPWLSLTPMEVYERYDDARVNIGSLWEGDDEQIYQLVFDVGRQRPTFILHDKVYHRTFRT